jgi:hypothetical protein
MKEVRTEVQVHIVRGYCDCGGEYTPDGKMLLTNPPKYPHHCSDCDDRQIFLFTYPRMVKGDSKEI